VCVVVVESIMMMLSLMDSTLNV